MKKINWIDHGLNMLSVIFGVSLAFGIGNYAQEQKQKRETELVISSILEEIEEDIETFRDYQIPDNQQKMKHLGKAMAYLSQSDFGDSLIFYLSNGALNVNSYSPTNVTLNSILSAGKIDIIKDFEIRKKLLTYRLGSQEAQIRGELQLEFYTERLIPWYLENPTFLQDPASTKEASAEILTLINLYRSFMNNKVEQYDYLLEKGESLRGDLISYQEREGFVVSSSMVSDSTMID